MLAQALILNDADNSPQGYIRISEQATNQIGLLSVAPVATDLPALTAQVQQCQAILRRFRNLGSWDLVAIQDLAEEREFGDQQMARANATENRLATMTTFAERLAALENPAPASRQKPMEVATPAAFSGSQPDLKRFKTQLSLVLADEGRFQDEQHRLRYCFSLLKGDAYTTMEPLVSPDGVNLADTAAFLTEITRIFGDSDEQGSASRELEKLKQGSRDFSRYYADFARLAAILGIEDRAKRYALERGLSQEVIASLCHQGPPGDETFDAYVDRLKRMDERIRRLKALSSSSSAKPQNPRPVPRTPASTASGTHPGPMDLSANKGQKLPTDERERRIRLGLCLYCGGTGHMANSCPKKSAYGALRAAAATSAVAVLAAPAADMSGNE